MRHYCRGPAQALLPADTLAQAKGGPYRPGAPRAPHCLRCPPDGAPTQRSSRSVRPCPSPGITRRTNRKRQRIAIAIRRRRAQLPSWRCATKGRRERSRRCRHRQQPKTSPGTRRSRRSNGRFHGLRRPTPQAPRQAENRCVMLKARATKHGGRPTRAARTRSRRPHQQPQAIPLPCPGLRRRRKRSQPRTPTAGRSWPPHCHAVNARIFSPASSARSGRGCSSATANGARCRSVRAASGATTPASGRSPPAFSRRT